MSTDQVRDFHLADLIAYFWRLPLVRMLLISLGLHAAVIVIVQPRRYLPAREVIVISARLADKTPEQTIAEVPSTPVVVPEPAENAPTPPLPVPEPESAPVVETKAPLPEPVPISPVEPAPSRPAVEVERKPPPSPPEASLPTLPVMLDTNWYEARQLDVQPKAAAPISPRYPPVAAKSGLEGTVKLKLRVDEFGLVREVEVEEGEPPGVFDDSALEAFRKARFEAARKEGRPVRALIYIRVKYELSDE